MYDTEQQFLGLLAKEPELPRGPLVDPYCSISIENLEPSFEVFDSNGIQGFRDLAGMGLDPFPQLNGCGLLWLGTQGPLVWVSNVGVQCVGHRATFLWAVGAPSAFPLSMSGLLNIPFGVQNVPYPLIYPTVLCFADFADSMCQSPVAYLLEVLKLRELKSTNLGQGCL